MVKKQYIRIIRKCKNNVRIELKDHSTLLVPIQEFSDWKCIEKKKDEKDKIKLKESNKEIKENIKKETNKKRIRSIKKEDNKEIRNITNKKVTKKDKTIGKTTKENKRNDKKKKQVDACAWELEIDLPENIIVENPYFLQTKHDKTIIGIDPSYTRTGIAILTKDGHLIFHTLSEQIGKKDFIHTYNSAYSLATQLRDYLEQFKPYDVVMEYAPPVSSMSPALYCLDALYHFVLHENIKHLYHPMTLATIIGKRDRTKADSVLKGLSIMRELQSAGWQIDQKRKPCHDCLEALIYVDYFLKNESIKE